MFSPQKTRALALKRIALLWQRILDLVSAQGGVVLLKVAYKKTEKKAKSDLERYGQQAVMRTK